MKIQELFENADKDRFQLLISKATLYHSTSERNAAKIRKAGLKAESYFSIGDDAWHGDVVLTVQGKKIAKHVYPDPEHLLEHDRIKKLKLKSISFQTVTQHIPHEDLFQMFFEIYKDHSEGCWVICTVPVPAKEIHFDETT